MVIELNKFLNSPKESFPSWFASASLNLFLHARIVSGERISFVAPPCFVEGEAGEEGEEEGAGRTTKEEREIEEE